LHLVGIYMTSLFSLLLYTHVIIRRNTG